MGLTSAVWDNFVHVFLSSLLWNLDEGVCKSSLTLTIGIRCICIYTIDIYHRYIVTSEEKFCSWLDSLIVYFGYYYYLNAKVYVLQNV